MGDNYQKALNKIKNDIKFLKFSSCCDNRNVNGVTGPTGPTERLFKSSNRIIIDSS